MILSYHKMGRKAHQSLLDARLEFIHHAEVVVDQTAALHGVTRQVACGQEKEGKRGGGREIFMDGSEGRWGGKECWVGMEPWEMKMCVCVSIILSWMTGFDGE